MSVSDLSMSFYLTYYFIINNELFTIVGRLRRILQDLVNSFVLPNKTLTSIKRLISVYFSVT